MPTFTIGREVTIGCPLTARIGARGGCARGGWRTDSSSTRSPPKDAFTIVGDQTGFQAPPE